MNATSLRLFMARTEIWFLLSGVLPLTESPGLWITLQIVAMPLSDRLARVHGESIPWSSTSWTLSDWNPVWGTSLTLIFWQLGVEVCWQACKYLARHILPHLPYIDCQLYLETLHSHIIRVITQPTLWTSFSSQSPLPPCNKILGVFFTSTNYATGVHISLETQMTLLEHYGQWSFIFNFEQWGNLLCQWCNLPQCHAACRQHNFCKIPSLLAAHDS